MVWEKHKESKEDGDTMASGPRRIVCLTAETVDMLYRLGAGDRIVGVSGYTVFPPEARKKPFVSAFTTIRYETIESLKPDLILGFSDLQAEAAQRLIERGFCVLVTNQRSLKEMLETLVMIGRIVDKHDEAVALAADLEKQLDAARASRTWTTRPKVYFEEWDDPLITGIGWVSELVEAAGGQDVFANLSKCVTASERIIEPETVAERSPDIILASWCGKKANLEAIRSREGWSCIPAVERGQVHEIQSAYCLQPGPALITEGLPRISAILNAWHRAQ